MDKSIVSPFLTHGADIIDSSRQSYSKNWNFNAK